MIHNSGNVIDNMIKYNKIPEDIIREFYLEHIFDTKNINQKLHIINSLESNNNQNDFTNKLRNVINKYIIDDLIVISDIPIL